MKSAETWAQELAKEEGYGLEVQAAYTLWIRQIQADAIRYAAEFCGGDTHIEDGILFEAKKLEPH